MKSKQVKTLRILMTVYAVLFVAFVIGSFAGGDYSLHNFDGCLALFLFMLFSAGFILLWTRIKAAGIVFMVWTAFAWISDLGLTRGKDSGMVSIMAVPVLLISAFLLLEWFKNTREDVPDDQLKTRFILRVLLLNYAVLYLVVVISELAYGRLVDYFRFPFIIFPVLLGLFIAGFILSWKRELHAGIILLVWTALLIFGSVRYFEIFNSGPWIFFGLPIAIQGLLYVQSHFRYRIK